MGHFFQRRSNSVHIDGQIYSNTYLQWQDLLVLNGKKSRISAGKLAGVSEKTRRYSFSHNNNKKKKQYITWYSMKQFYRPFYIISKRKHISNFPVSITVNDNCYTGV